jgi:hypothetical protein
MGESMDGHVIDARGVRSRVAIHDEYNNALDPEMISGPDAENLIRHWIATGRLEDFLPGEHEALTLYVKALQKYPCMVVLPDSSPWHSFEGSEIPGDRPFTDKAVANNDLNFELG